MGKLHSNDAVSVGVGLRQPHYSEVIDTKPDIGWFEVHSENFFYDGVPAIDALLAVREHYPISLHGVGLSLGSAGGVSTSHLKRLSQLIQSTKPFLISEHLSWGEVNGVHMPDLLPVPYTKESLEVFCNNIARTQDYLGSRILIENPSSYLEYKASSITEIEFLVEICERTGAQILLDVNNIFVSCSNHGWDAANYINSVPASLVGEIHLAGHSIKQIADNVSIRVDTHDHKVCDEVWALYEYTINKIGGVPTLLEWDAQIPPLAVLLSEAYKAASYMNTAGGGMRANA